MLIAGLEPYSEGAITCGDELVFEPSPSRGVVFQNYSLYPWLTVKGNVEFPLAEQSLNRRERGELAMSHLEQIGLSEFADSYPSQLSGGMRQRVAIARALAAKPRLLLMDEPFGALDAQTRELMQELLTRVWEQDRMTVVFITHDVEEAIFLSDRVLLMSARPGRIKEDVTIELPRPRSFDLLMTTEVLAYKQRLLTSIREEALRSAGGAFGVLSPASANGRPASDDAAESRLDHRVDPASRPRAPRLSVEDPRVADSRSSERPPRLADRGRDCVRRAGGHASPSRPRDNATAREAMRPTRRRAATRTSRRRD